MKHIVPAALLLAALLGTPALAATPAGFCDAYPWMPTCYAA